MREPAGTGQSGPGSLLLGLPLLFAAYVAAGALGERLAMLQLAAIFWPPVGVLLAALLTSETRLWTVCLLVCGAAELTWNALAWHNPLPWAVVYFAGNAAEVLAAAWLIRRLHAGPLRLETVREFAVFVLAGLLAPVVSATVIATSNALRGSSSFGETWPLAWLGDASGLLVATPLVLVVLDAWRRRESIARATQVELLVTVAAFAALVLLAHGTHLPVIYAALPLVLWAAFRFYLRGAAVAIGLLVIGAAIVTPARLAAMSADQVHERAVMLLSVLGISAILAVLVATLALERRQALQALRTLNATLEARVLERTAALAAREQELRDALATAADLERRKDAFIAMLAHELRNPLAPIRHATEWLARAAGDHPPVARVLPMLIRQGRQLGRLVDDLLDAARISHDRIRLDRRALDIDEVVAQAVESVQPLLTERAHPLTVTREAQHASVYGDAGRLAQCVGNLLTNAAKFSAPGAAIELAVRVTDEQIEIAVRDRGTGIDPDLLPRVFEPFVQGAQTLDRSLGGLGIGLTLVKRIVELHGGTVTAHSDGPGAGSTFVLRVPRMPGSRGTQYEAPVERRVGIG